MHVMIALDNALAEKAFDQPRQDDQWKLEQGAPWIQQMLVKGLLQSGSDCWGFVLFRTGFHWTTCVIAGRALGCKLKTTS